MDSDSDWDPVDSDWYSSPVDLDSDPKDSDLDLVDSTTLLPLTHWLTESVRMDD